jgi:hypothetical protein
VIQLAFSLLFFLLDVFFFGDFRKLDLKLPLRGSFTIHDGGTMIPLCEPKIKHENYIILEFIIDSALMQRIFISLLNQSIKISWILFGAMNYLTET